MLMSGFVSFNLNLSAQDIKSTQSTVRAAIDFGSGAVKIQMAVVDTQENRIIGKPLIAKYVPLGLTEDVATHEGLKQLDKYYAFLDNSVHFCVGYDP
jgi:hypothetical protein